MTKIFKYTALLEGISLLALLFFAMPMKYIANDPFYVKHIGMAHGLLFLAYIVFATVIKFENKWNLKKYIIICIASVIPFGTFYVEKKYLTKEV